MNLFALNILLAVTWQALVASFDVPNLILGFALGYAALWMAQPLFGQKSPYFVALFRIVRLILYFLYEFVISSIRVAWDVVTPRHHSSPAILQMPLDVKSDFEILLVTNLISLTPGTLSLDVTPDRKTLFVHAMFAEDPDALVAELKNGMERMVREVFEV